MTLWFGALGPLVVYDGEAEVAVGGPMARQLLAALLGQANRTISADALIDQLWPGPAPNGRKNLQILVHRLRRALGDERIEYRNGSYLLHVKTDECDALSFQDLLRAGRSAHAAGDLATAEKALAEALALWRGAPYADVPSVAVLVPEVERLNEAWLLAIEEKTTVDLALGRSGDLVPELRNLVAAHPYREVMIGHLMTALYRSGRQAEALKVFRQARTDLVEHLAVEPGAPLQELHHAILRADLALSAGNPPAAVSTARAVQTVPITSTKGDAPRALPHDVADFSGRHDHIAQLDGLLADQHTTSDAPFLITAITGTAGVGKTALAVHWAHRVAHRFPDGQLYVNLHGYSANGPIRPIDALSSLMRIMGIPSEAIPPDEAEAAALYRSHLAQRRVLIVLDNAGFADQVRPLLPGSPGSLALITSRSALGELVAYDGIRRVRLDVLSSAEAEMLLRHLLGAHRIETEPAAVRDLIGLCANLPLALRVAAANLTERPSGSIARYVADLRANALSALSLDGEQSAVRAALELSYRNESPAVRRTFRLLGLIPGADASVPAVAALAGIQAGEAARHLHRLASAHLVQTGAADDYTFHDLLRQFARECATIEEPAAERAAAVERLLAWCIATCEAAAARMYPAVVRLAGDGSRRPAVPIELADAKAAAAWLDREWHNIFALIRYAGTEGPKDLACQLADSVRGYLGRRGHLADWYTAADIALAAAREIGDKRAQVAALLSRAQAHQTRYVLQSALDDLRAAQAICEEIDWPEVHFSLLSSLGGVLTDMGQPLASIPLLNHAIEIGDRINASVRRTTARINLAYTLVNLGRTAEAVASAEETLRLIEGTGASSPTLLENLGNAQAIRGSYGVAKELIGQAVTMRRKTEDRRGEGITLIHLAVTDYDAGLNDEADAMASAVLHFALEYADRRNETYSNVIAGYVALRAGDLGRADDKLRRAQSIATTASSLPVLQARIGLAAVATGRGDFSVAAELLEHALATTRANGLRLMEGEILTSQARLALLQDDVMQAFALAHEAADLRRSTEHRLGEALSLGLVLKAADRIGDGAARVTALSRLDQLKSHLDVSLEDRPLIGAM